MLMMIEQRPVFTYNSAHNYQYRNNTMTDSSAKPAIPDMLSINPRSKFYNEEILKHEIGVRFNGKERFDVEEYCISEGWIKVAAQKALDRRGQPLLMKSKGTVEVFYRES